MLYTLLKFLGWGILLAIIGGCVGWALRSLKCRGEVARAKSSSVDGDEVERMRHRLANLEQVVAERDRLRIQLADVRHADSPGIVGAKIPEPEPEGSEPEQPADAAQSHDAGTDDAAPSTEQSAGDDETQPDGDEAATTAPETVVDDAAAVSTTDADSAPTEDSDAIGADVGDTSTDEPSDDEPADLDLGVAAAVLGKKIELDDLTVVEGIGPKISELCRGIGVTTWRGLADADVAELQSMLDAAGSRYTVHKPGTWPRQAELLATGEWAEFKSLTEELDGGK